MVIFPAIPRILVGIGFAGFAGFVAVSALACTKSSTPAPDASPPAMPTTATTTTTATTSEHLWRDDGYPEAKAAAATAGKLLLVDASADWCHTCLSMERDVLHRPEVQARAADFVMLRVDTDRPESAAFTTRFAVRVWPTFFVIDPGTEAVVASYGGSMSVTEFDGFLARALLVRQGTSSPADVAMTKGYAALKAGQHADAATAFATAFRDGGPRILEAASAAVRSWRQAENHEQCVRMGLEALAVVKAAAGTADLADWTTACAEALPEAAPLRREALTTITTRLEHLTSAPPADASVDDKADALRMLAERYQTLDRADDARAAHTRRLALLEADATAANTPEGARVHDYARMVSLLEVGRGDDAVALLQARVKEFPDNYEPWARLASTLHRLGRDQEALKASTTALAKSYGPRRLRYLSLDADIREALGDTAGMVAALSAVVKDNANLPAEVQLSSVATAAETRLKSLEAAKAP